ncbi:hypothetical protein Q1695_005157 [Nippostrongylus brasiliensis]|nr:hypothetical protein Q1695_005157 [Nippostrongylus brasiliensis]
MSSKTTRKAAKRTRDSKETATPGPLKTLFGVQNKRAKATEDLDSVQKPQEGCSGDVKALIPDSVRIPKFISDFYQHAKSISSEDPCLAFKKLKSARLVGLFELLDGKLSTLSENDLLLHRRHATDLPEMQTVLESDVGRYCLWRDIPNSDDGLIVYVPDDGRFPKIEVVGDRVEHAIVHLAEKAKAPVESLLPKSSNVANLKQQMKAVSAKRNKKKYGKAPSGAGLWVEVVNEVGYRPIVEDAAKIRKSLDLLCSTADDDLKQAKTKWLMELVTWAQIATDECDFGMGLELGQWLFLANHPMLDRLAQRLLSTAYALLGRNEYKAVLDLQMADGVRRRSELDARKTTTS